MTISASRSSKRSMDEPIVEVVDAAEEGRDIIKVVEGSELEKN